MVEEVVDKVIEIGGLLGEVGKCRIYVLGVVGAYGYINDLFV